MPRRLAPGSVDFLIGKLRAIYNRLGRFGLVNPVSHSLIKEILKIFKGRASGFGGHFEAGSPSFLYEV